MVALILCLMCASVVYVVIKLKRKVGTKLKGTGAAILAKVESWEAAAEKLAKAPKALSEALQKIVEKAMSANRVELLDGNASLVFDAKDRAKKDPTKAIGIKILYKIHVPAIDNALMISACVMFDSGFATILLFSADMQNVISPLGGGYLHKEPGLVKALVINKLYALMNSEEEIERVTDILNGVDENADKTVEEMMEELRQAVAEKARKSA